MDASSSRTAARHAYRLLVSFLGRPHTRSLGSPTAGVPTANVTRPMPDGAVLVLTVVSVPMLIDRRVGIGSAVSASIQACMVNPGPMAIWGLIVA